MRPRALLSYVISPHLPPAPLSLFPDLSSLSHPLLPAFFSLLFFLYILWNMFHPYFSPVSYHFPSQVPKKAWPAFLSTKFWISRKENSLGPTWVRFSPRVNQLCFKGPANLVQMIILGGLSLWEVFLKGECSRLGRSPLRSPRKNKWPIYLEGGMCSSGYEKAAIGRYYRDLSWCKRWKARCLYYRKLCYALKWSIMLCFPTIILFPNLWLAILTFWNSRRLHLNAIFLS